MLLAGAALILGLWAGLLRLGWAWPSLPNLAAAHGPLMIAGFLGVLIPLERAVALRQTWMLAVPVLAGLGWISALMVPLVGAGLWALSGLGTLGILLVMVRHEPRLHTVTMALGAAALALGNLLWLGRWPLFQVVLWWVPFLTLTIGGERLELSRVLRLTRAQTGLFAGLVALALAGAGVATLAEPHWGARMLGMALVGLALWFMRYDVAARNLRHPNPLTRYIALSLFGGYLWLAVAGAVWLGAGGLVAGPLYDAALHAVFVGFVFTMIFGHAPIIFPALLGVVFNFRPVLYGPLAGLHLSLLSRILGDVLGVYAVRQWGGLLNAVAIVAFVALMAGLSRRSPNQAVDI